MSEAIDDVVHEFIVESTENLDRLDADLVELEKNPKERERLSSIFRTIHTIKGTCGFLAFKKLESITHVGENLLSKLRDGLLSLDAARTSVLLAMVDAVRKILAEIETTGQEGDGDYQTLIAELTRLLDPGAGAAGGAAAPPTPAKEETAAAPAANEAAMPAADSSVVEAVAAKVEVAQPAAPTAEAPEAAHAPEVAHAPIEHADHGHAPTNESAERKPAIADNSIRVNVELLDNLMNLVGELVLARNQMMQFTSRLKDANIAATSQRLNLITTELQERVMKTRMQPIGNIWGKFPRVVRDLAVICGKQVKIEMEGQETELDKTLIEAIKDPLTHIVRNSVDHGIEKPEARTAKGKPAAGTLSLRAYHEGGQVNIEIADDGGGISAARVKAKAVEKGLISEDQASRLSEREIIGLLFLPGFSTAEKVTNVSGRGVGMDVVKTNIERIGGQLEIQSVEGKGTTIKIKIPLTLAIIPALIVSTSGDRYAIPQLNLLELVRLESTSSEQKIETIHGAKVFRLRGKLLPIIHLSEILRVPPPANTQTSINIVVLQADGRTFGLVVDGIDDTEEIVVKPLSKYIKGIHAYAGVTIMGDGRVALILDVVSLAQMTGVVSEQHERVHADSRHASGDVRKSDNEMMLVVSIGNGRRLAIPLSTVARLEEVPTTSIEISGDNEVVQYRQQIMPLIRLASLFGGAYGGGDGETKVSHVVVYTDQKSGRSVGLVVEKIVDIVSDHVEVKRKVYARGVVASAVIGGKVTEIIDIESIIRDAIPVFFEMNETEPALT